MVSVNNGSSKVSSNGGANLQQKQQNNSNNISSKDALSALMTRANPSVSNNGSILTRSSGANYNQEGTSGVVKQPQGADFSLIARRRSSSVYKNLPLKRTVTEFGITVDEVALKLFRLKKTNTSPFDASLFLPMLKACPKAKTGKMTLVLDIDETMVHSSLKPRDGKYNPDTVIPITTGGQTGEIFVKYRPRLMEFLEAVKPLFEVVVFTASMGCYADQLLDTIDPKGDLITDRLYRQHCTELKGARVKDLTLLGRTLERMVILDNSPVAYLFQQRNAIPILSWFDDPNDTELLKLIPFLQELATHKTVYPLLDMYNVAAQAPISPTDSVGSGGNAL